MLQLVLVASATDSNSRTSSPSQMEAPSPNSYYVYNVIPGTVPVTKAVKYILDFQSNIVQIIPNITAANGTAEDVADKWWFGTQFVMSHNDQYTLFQENELPSRSILSLVKEDIGQSSASSLNHVGIRSFKSPAIAATEAMEDELKAAKGAVGSFSMGRPTEVSTSPNTTLSFHHRIPGFMIIDSFSSISMLTLLHQTSSMCCGYCSWLVGFHDFQPITAINATIDTSKEETVNDVVTLSNLPQYVWLDYFTVDIYAFSFLQEHEGSSCELSHSVITSIPDISIVSPNLSLLNSTAKEEDCKASDADATATLSSDEPQQRRNAVVATLHFSRVGSPPQPANYLDDINNRNSSSEEIGADDASSLDIPSGEVIDVADDDSIPSSPNITPEIPQEHPFVIDSFIVDMLAAAIFILLCRYAWQELRALQRRRDGYNPVLNV